MIQVTFFKKNGNLHFCVPEMPELEAAIKAIVKRHYVKTGKKEFFFRRGIQDAANSIQSGEPRKFGSPMVEVKNPFSGVTKIMPCQEAYMLLHDVGGNYFIRQVSGSTLPPDYFNFRNG